MWHLSVPLKLLSLLLFVCVLAMSQVGSAHSDHLCTVSLGGFLLALAAGDVEQILKVFDDVFTRSRLPHYGCVYYSLGYHDARRGRSQRREALELPFMSPLSWVAMSCHCHSLFSSLGVLLLQGALELAEPRAPPAGAAPRTIVCVS